MSFASRAKVSPPIQIEIAGVPFAVQSDSSSHNQWLPIMYKRFLTGRKPQAHLTILTKNWETSKQNLVERMVWTGSCWNLEALNFRIREVEPGVAYEAEISADDGLADLLRTWFSFVILSRGGILLHSAAVVQNGRVLVFCGPSGSGKTTLARLAGRRPLLSDESVAVTFLPSATSGTQVCWAHATPFFGELTECSGNLSAPIAEVFLIGLRKETLGNIGVRLRPASRSEAMALLLTQTFLRTLSRPWLDRIFPLLENLACSVRIRRLQFEPSPGIWEMLDDRSR